MLLEQTPEWGMFWLKRKMRGRVNTASLRPTGRRAHSPGQIIAQPEHKQVALDPVEVIS